MRAPAPTSRFLGLHGVSYDRAQRGEKPFRARVYFQGKCIDIGRYRMPEEAAAAYDQAVEHLAPYKKICKNSSVLGPLPAVPRDADIDRKMQQAIRDMKARDRRHGGVASDNTSSSSSSSSLWSAHSHHGGADAHQQRAPPPVPPAPLSYTACAVTAALLAPTEHGGIDAAAVFSAALLAGNSDAALDAAALYHFQQQQQQCAPDMQLTEAELDGLGVVWSEQL